MKGLGVIVNWGRLRGPEKAGSLREKRGSMPGGMIVVSAMREERSKEKLATDMTLLLLAVFQERLALRKNRNPQKRLLDISDKTPHIGCWNIRGQNTPVGS